MLLLLAGLPAMFSRCLRPSVPLQPQRNQISFRLWRNRPPLTLPKDGAAFWRAVPAVGSATRRTKSTTSVALFHIRPLPVAPVCAKSRLDRIHQHILNCAVKLLCVAYHVVVAFIVPERTSAAKNSICLESCVPFEFSKDDGHCVRRAVCPTYISATFYEVSSTNMGLVCHHTRCALCPTNNLCSLICVSPRNMPEHYMYMVRHNRVCDQIVLLLISVVNRFIDDLCNLGLSEPEWTSRITCQ